MTFDKLLQVWLKSKCKPAHVDPPRYFNNIRALSIWLTNRCNFNCYFCPVVKSEDRKTELRLKSIEKFINRSLTAFPNLETVSFSGGEPLLHPKFSEVYDLIRNVKQFNFELYTNGVLLDKISTDVLEGFTRIYISLHSIKHYNEVFGLSSGESAKNRVLDILSSFSEKMKGRTTVSVGLNKFNQNDSLHEIFEFAITNNLESVNVFPIRSFRNAYNLRENIAEEKIEHGVLELIDKYSNRLQISPCKHTMGKMIKIQEKTFRWSQPCLAPYRGIILDYNEEIKLCCGDQPPIGLADNIPDIFYNKTAEKIFRESTTRTGVCSGCFFGEDACARCYIKKRLKLMRRP